MVRNSRRLLIAGASVIAIGMASPGAASVVPGIDQSTTQVNVDTVLTISNIGDNFTFGVDDVTDGVATATVNSTGTGEISQVADANGTTAGLGNATVVLNNSGTATVRALADATGTSTLSASANAYVNTGVYQSIEANDAASLKLNNTGSLTIQAEAIADADADATAAATVNTGISQTATGKSASVALNNPAGAAITISAIGNATGDNAEADAAIRAGISQDAYANDGNATVTLTNSGTLTLAGSATANAVDNADASVEDASDLVLQYAQADNGGIATAIINNTGTVNLTADAVANGATAYAYADASTALYQSVSANGTASTPGTIADATLTNASSGVINAKSNATANASVNSAQARAYTGYVAKQSAEGNDGANASVTLTNNGKIDVATIAKAIAEEGYANATASNYDIVSQNADTSGGGDATNLVTNTSKILVNADANASGTGAYANMDISYVIDQSASADSATTGEGTVIASGNASNTLTNASTGLIKVDGKATAKATATDANAQAYATVANAVYQNAYSDDGAAENTVTNNGTFSITTAANATTAGSVLSANAAIKNAIWQRAEATSGSAADVIRTATNTVTNTGTIDLNATATALAGNANANVQGVVQLATGIDTASVNFTNSNVFNVDANAVANGATAGFARANAVGVSQEAYGSEVAYNFTNSKTFTVDAAAKGTTGSVATAQGLVLNASTTETYSTQIGTGPDSTPLFTTITINVGTQLAGIVTNSGTFNVTAQADAASAVAVATGIVMTSGPNTAVLNNTGTLQVSALTTDGISDATGILVQTVSTDALGPRGLITPRDVVVPDVFTINNTGGTIIARNSVDNGATWTHGLAIDTSNAPNATVINLKANGTTNGYIYGDIDLQAGDTINVSAGTTSFDGTINPGLELEGTLNILDGGKLLLVDQPTGNVSYDGAAQVNVDALNIAAGGTLALQLPNYAAASVVYPTIVANTATLAGTLEVRPQSDTGLYADTYSFDNVIDAETRTGTFSNVTIAGGTPLLTAAATYDANGNVDIAVNRVAFDAVAGLTPNQDAVAGGLESFYASDLTGPAATLAANLFTRNAAGYAAALDQLSGAQYATYLQSLSGVGSRFNALLSEVGECAVQPELRKVCRSEGTGRVWGQANYGRTTKDGDVNAAGYKSNEYFIALGTDFDVAPEFIVGVSAAYVKHDLALDRHNGKIDSDGFQIGGYAVYAPGQAYAKGVVSYTDLNGTSRRSVDIGTTNGTVSGKPDSRIWTLSGEVGYNLNLGSSTITPYAGLDYTAAKLKGFTETGLAAANLDVFESTHNRAASTLGAKWTGKFGNVVPEIDLGWRHQFGDRQAAITEAFDLGNSDTFGIVSPFEKRDQAVVGVAVSGKLASQVNFRIGYKGAFNGDTERHSGGVTLIVPFGGSR